MFTEEQLTEIREYLSNTPPNSNVYLGCDSMRLRKNGKQYALFTVVLIVHLGGNHGCKLFGYNVVEVDYDTNQKKPFNRLMMEAVKVSELYQELEYDLVEMNDIEIHLDVNSLERYGSHCAVRAACGYVLGTCGIYPKIKPEAWAATTAADHMVRQSFKKKFKYQR